MSGYLYAKIVHVLSGAWVKASESNVNGVPMNMSARK